MSNKIQSLRLEQFTTFEQATFEFCPGINVLIGANSMGKTHVMKVMYAILTLLKISKRNDSGEEFAKQTFERIINIFGLKEFELRENREHLIRNKKERASIYMQCGLSEKIWLSIGDIGANIFTERDGSKDFTNLPVLYLPSQEFLSINEGFIASYIKRELPYDATYYDLAIALNAAPLRQNSWGDMAEVIRFVETILMGEESVENMEIISQQNGRFYFNLPEGKNLDVHLVADGYRKLGTLLYLLRNGSLTSDTVLFWDEPETSLNPKMIVKVAEILRLLAQAGVQIFIATHDYLLSHTLSLWAEYPSADKPLDMRFFALHRPDRAAGVEVEMGQTLADIQHNPILEEFAAHYDREAQFFARSDGA